MPNFRTEIGEKEERSLSEYYVISSFVVLVALMKHHICIPWEDTIKLFMQSFGGVFLVAKKYFDDLETQFHMMGVYSSSALGMGS